MVACSQNGILEAATQEVSPPNSLSPKAQKPALPLNAAATLAELPSTLGVNKQFGNTSMEELLQGLYQDANADSQGVASAARNGIGNNNSGAAVAVAAGGVVGSPARAPAAVAPVSAGMQAARTISEAAWSLATANSAQQFGGNALEVASPNANMNANVVGALISKILPGQVQKQVAAQLAAAAAAAQAASQAQDQPKGRDIRAIQRQAKEKKANRSSSANKEAKAEEAAVAEEYPQDSYSAKKKRRMVKNRESAARSRQRKQEQLDTLEKKVSGLLAENQELRNRIRELESNQSRE